MAPRARRHARAADDEGHADAAFPEAALAAAQALGGAFAALAATTAAAIVCHVDHVGVLLEAQRRDGGQQFADAGIEIVSDGRPRGVVVQFARGLGLELGEAGAVGVLGHVQGVIGHLQVERLTRLDVLLHERLGAVGHPEDIDGVGILVRVGVAVAGVTVAHVIAMLFGPGPAEVPFAEVGRRVAALAQQLGEGHLLVTDSLAVVAFDQLVAGLGRGGLGPTQPGRRHPRLQADAGRRTDRRRGVAVAEAHALGRELLEVGRLEVIAAGFGDVRMHADREPVPVLVIGKDQDDVRPVDGRCVGGGEQGAAK